MEFTLQTEPGPVPYLTVPGFGGEPGEYRIRLAFTTRLGGVSAGSYASLNLGLSAGDDPGLVMKNRELLCRTLGLDIGQLSLAKQVHGDRVLVITDRQHIANSAVEADAQVTALPGVPLMGLFADCLAVYLYDPVHGVMGLAHAGWRGTVAGIASQAVAVMVEQFGIRPEDCHAALAPAAGPCCYEVGEEVADAARQVFPAEWKVLRPRMEHENAAGNKPGVQRGQWTFDLWEGNARWLQSAGLKREHIFISRFCTICRQDLFFSYRGGAGHTGRMAALMIMDN